MRVAIICIGNEWQADDGFGVAVLRYLEERYAFGPEVSLLDRAVMGYGIVPDLLACDAAVVVDALDGTGAPPGTLFSFDPEDMACAPRMASLHEVRFADVLASARFMGAACAGYCLGVQVERAGGMGLEQGLSNAVAQAVPLCARSVVRVVERRFGCAVHDAWAELRDARALLLDARAYVRESLAACGVTATEEMLALVPGQMPDYKADALVERIMCAAASCENGSSAR